MLSKRVLFLCLFCVTGFFLSSGETLANDKEKQTRSMEFVVKAANDKTIFARAINSPWVSNSTVP